MHTVGWPISVVFIFILIYTLLVLHALFPLCMYAGLLSMTIVTAKLITTENKTEILEELFPLAASVFMVPGILACFYIALMPEFLLPWLMVLCAIFIANLLACLAWIIARQFLSTYFYITWYIILLFLGCPLSLFLISRLRLF